MLDMAKPLILVSNDDGIESRGIHALVDFLRPYGDIAVVAPAEPQSGKSSSLTVETPLRVKQLEDYNGAKMYRVGGTPVDCTKLALSHLLGRTPDYVVAGINHGSNAGNNAIYSGTMGIVFEACMNHIPAVGFSLLSHSPAADFSDCEGVVRCIMDMVMAQGLPVDVCLNVNIPARMKVLGVKAAVAARGRWTEDFEKQTDPHGRDIYWLTGKYVPDNPDDDTTDIYWLDRGYATAVPCMPDQSVGAFVPTLAADINKYSRF